MDINLVKQEDNSFIVAYQTDYDKIKKIKVGKVIACKITQPRNLRLHNKFMALIRMVYNNQEHYVNFDHLRKDLTIAAGFYDIRYSFDGEEIREAQSLKFGSMSEEVFQDLYSKVIDEIVKHFHFDKDLIKQNVKQFF